MMEDEYETPVLIFEMLDDLPQHQGQKLPGVLKSIRKSLIGNRIDAGVANSFLSTAARMTRKQQTHIAALLHQRKPVDTLLTSIMFIYEILDGDEFSEWTVLVEANLYRLVSMFADMPLDEPTILHEISDLIAGTLKEYTQMSSEQQRAVMDVITAAVLTESVMGEKNDITTKNAEHLQLMWEYSLTDQEIKNRIMAEPQNARRIVQMIKGGEVRNVALRHALDHPESGSTLLGGVL